MYRQFLKSLYYISRDGPDISGVGYQNQPPAYLIYNTTISVSWPHIQYPDGLQLQYLAS